MINVVFEKTDVKRLTGYSKRDIYVENKIVKQVSETELNKLIPDSFDADNWKEVRKHYKLENGEIVFDEDYNPNEEE